MVGIDCKLLTEKRGTTLDRLYVFDRGDPVIKAGKEYTGKEFLGILGERMRLYGSDRYFDKWLKVAIYNAGKRNIIVNDNDPSDLWDKEHL